MVVLKYRTGATLVLGFLGLALVVTALIALFTRYRFDELSTRPGFPVLILAIPLLVLLTVMSWKNIWQVVCAKGSAVWISMERLNTPYWSEALADVENVTFVPDKRMWLFVGGAIAIDLRGGRSRYIPTAGLEGNGTEMADVLQHEVRHHVQRRTE
jgi:hypothetical protein